MMMMTSNLRCSAALTRQHRVTAVAPLSLDVGTLRRQGCRHQPGATTLKVHIHIVQKA
jgi:hypothetical protein